MDALFDYVSTGGLFMYPILIGALWALTLLVERVIYFLQTASLLTRQRKRFFTLLGAEGPENARKYLDGQKGVLKNALAAGMAARTQPSDRIEEKMETVLLRDLPSCGKYLNLLATLGTMMPMLGLLGTVTGMIATFKVIALHGTGDAQAMADGISEALITTQAGLVAALPIVLGHTLLSNRLKKITDTVRESCALLLDYLKETHA